jgi:hypothetical protein
MILADFTCRHCGERFTRRRDLRPVYCSRRCQQRGRVRFSLNAAELRRRYVDDRKTAMEIARELGVSETLVLLYLRRFEIAPRHGHGGRLATRTLSLEHLPPAERGYLAGFIDGEGYVSIAGRRPHALNPRVMIANTHLATMNYLASLLGAGTRVLERKRARAYHRQGYIILVDRMADVLHLLETVFPYMVTKRRQADLVMAFCRSRLARHGAREFQLSPEEWTLYEMVSQLNRRPKAPQEAAACDASPRS